MITGNKGEWSEIYTLFKLLGDTVIYPGDEKIEKISNIIYPIIKVLRTESSGSYEYSIEDSLVIISGNEEVLKIPINSFKEKAIALLEIIKTNPSGTFAIPEIQDFMESVHCISLKAKSSRKTDITIVIHDERTNQTPTLGFSIKSQLGRPSTLLNAGKTTNFTFKITDVELTSKEITTINSIEGRSKIMDRVQAIYNKGGKLKFMKVDKRIFSNNLILIDSLLPQIIAKILHEHYTSNDSTTVNLLSIIETQNPLNFDMSNHHQFYTYKIKRFLTDVALGMMPSKVWTGEYDVTGGYLIVKRDGDVLCYHIYNRNDFENYLINNTKLETASSTRHKFGEIYNEDGELFFKLNLQIRFIK
jgi:hypothetical protein